MPTVWHMNSRATQSSSQCRTANTLITRLTSRRLRRTNNKVTDQICTDVPGRVAKQLLLLAQQFGTREGTRCIGCNITALEAIRVLARPNGSPRGTMVPSAAAVPSFQGLVPTGRMPDRMQLRSVPAISIFSDGPGEKFTVFGARTLHNLGVEPATFAGMHHRIHPQRHPHMCSHGHRH
jgi:hypothetical protein